MAWSVTLEAKMLMDMSHGEYYFFFTSAVDYDITCIYFYRIFY